MVAFDDSLLRADPAVIALGAHSGTSEVADAVANPGRETPACSAAVSGYRTALMFRILFTSLVFGVGLVAALALAYAVIKTAAIGVDVSAIVAGVGGVLGGFGTGFLVKQMRSAIRVENAALGNVDKYCGAEFSQTLK